MAVYSTSETFGPLFHVTLSLDFQAVRLLLHAVYHWIVAYHPLVAAAVSCHC